MDTTSWAACWSAFFDRNELPKECRSCGDPHVVRNGTAERSATVRENDATVTIPRILLRRVKCVACRLSWRLYPPGLLPRRRFQLCVVSDAASEYLFNPLATRPAVAAAATCAVRTVGRWIHWVAAIAEPANIQARLVEVLDEAVVPLFPEAVVRNPLVGGMLRRAAANLVLIEALARSVGLEPPGLRSLVVALVAGRDGSTTYARPIIPEFASRGLGGRSATLAM
jgi:hypothetical protein